MNLAQKTDVKAELYSSHRRLRIMLRKQITTCNFDNVVSELYNQFLVSVIKFYKKFSNFILSFRSTVIKTIRINCIHLSIRQGMGMHSRNYLIEAFDTSVACNWSVVLFAWNLFCNELFCFNIVSPVN